MKYTVSSFLAFTLTALNAAESTRVGKVEFNRDVPPILSENCYACHGFDPKHREADLRLVTFEGATEDRDGSRGIVPGDVAKSDARQRIISDDKDEVMPPPKSHKPPLTAKQREILKIWIEQGAKYERHWSFEPPKKSAGGSIDHFIQQRLAEENLKPSPVAEPATLIRRVSRCLPIRRRETFLRRGDSYGQQLNCNGHKCPIRGRKLSCNGHKCPIWRGELCCYRGRIACELGEHCICRKRPNRNDSGDHGSKRWGL